MAETTASRSARRALFEARLARARAALRRLRRPRAAAALALAAIVAIAFVARDVRSRQGLPYLHHWDEPFLVHRSLEILRTGDFNPRFFNYGSLLIYAGAAASVTTYLALAQLPDGAPEALREPAEIRYRGAREDGLTTTPGAQPYWISHPSFYRAARRVNVLFGALSVLLVFSLGRMLAGRVAGLAAAFVLATNEFHIEHSSWATTDVPAAAFALAVLWATLRFRDGGGPGMLLLAAAALGLAVSTKYNSALVGLVPIATLAVATVHRPVGYRPWLWIAAPAAAGAAFLATSPFALLDLPTFLRDTGRMLHAYLGVEGSTLWVDPGWPHLRLDLALLRSNLGAIVTAGAIVGTALALRRASGWFVLPIGLLVLVATSQTGAPFHRNVVVCYPLAAVAFGVALAAALRTTWRPVASRAVALVLVFGALAAGTRGLLAAVHHGLTPDTRSQLVDRLAELGDVATGEHLGIAAELNLHGLDLSRLGVRHQVRPLRELLCAPRGETAVVVPSRPWSNFRAASGEQTTFEQLIAATGPVLLAIEADRGFSLDAPVIGPGLWVRRIPADYVPPALCAGGEIALDQLSLAGESGRNPKSVGLAPGASARTPTYRFEPGRLLVAVEVVTAQSGLAAACEIEARRAESETDPPLARWRLAPSRVRGVEGLALPLTASTPLFFEVRVPADSPGGLLLYGFWLDSEPLDTITAP